MNMQQSGMSSAIIADGSSSSTGVTEWRGWPKAHTSAVVIIPPESCWPQIQDIRRLQYSVCECKYIHDTFILTFKYQEVFAIAATDSLSDS